MVSENDVQRLFLQAIISRRVVPKKLAQILWVKCIEAVTAANEHLVIAHSDDRGSWDNFIGQVNTSLDRLDLEFRHLHDEVTSQEMYALVNRKGDEIAQMATDYSAVEIAFFKAIVEQIMLAPNESFSVSSLAALREVNTLKSNMTKAQAEVVLGSFVAKGWLIKSPRGRYSLATRTLLELGPYLKSTYSDEIVECTICFEIVTRGVACFTPNCQTRMHTHCFRNFRQRHQACPACSKKWPQGIEAPLVSVGENALKNGQDENRRGIRKKSMAAESQDALEDQEMNEDEPSQAEARTQPKKEKKKVRMAVTGDEDDDGNAPMRSQRRSRR